MNTTQMIIEKEKTVDDGIVKLQLVVTLDGDPSVETPEVLKERYDLEMDKINSILNQ